MLGIGVGDHGGQQRLVPVHHRLDDNRAGGGERRIQHWPGLLRPLDGVTPRAHGLRRLGEVDPRDLHAEIRVAEEQELLPLDLAERAVAQHQQLQRQAHGDGGGELAELHGQPAIADHAEDRPAGEGAAGGNRVRDGAGHRGQQAGDAEIMPRLHPDVARDQAGMVAAVGHHHCIRRQPRAEGRDRD